MSVNQSQMCFLFIVCINVRSVLFIMCDQSQMRFILQCELFSHVSIIMCVNQSKMSRQRLLTGLKEQAEQHRHHAHAHIDRKLIKLMAMAVQAKGAVDQEFHPAMEEHKEIEEQLKENLRTGDQLEKAIEDMRKPLQEKGQKMGREEKKQRKTHFPYSHDHGGASKGGCEPRVPQGHANVFYSSVCVINLRCVLFTCGNQSQM